MMATTTIDLCELKRFIDEHIYEIHAIQDLSQQLAKSPKSLRRVFKRSGEVISLGAYLTQTRVQILARDLVDHPELRCYEIGLLVGIERLDVAAHVFKRAYGMTMQQYRNLQTES